MHVEWSGLGPELLVTLDRSSSTGLRVQLERQLRTAIRDGRLAPSERLPSSRELAAALGLSRGLVQECYAQLTAEGYLETRTGSATRVKGAGPGAPVSTWLPRVPVQLPPPSIADFRSGVPDLGLAPRADWAWAVREACRTMPDEALGYGDSAGDLHLRGVLAAYLGRVRAALCTADQVALSTGMAQALSLVMQVFADLGYTTIAYEDPGPVLSTPRRADVTGLKACPIPVDADGIDVEALRRSNADVVLVTPAHQWPTGVVMAGTRRLELMAWARERGGLIVEDDYDAEFRYDRDPVGTLQGLTPDCVVSMGTMSKTLAPALRIGWIVAPEHIIARVAAAKDLADRGSSGIDQRALALLMESGRYDRHLRRMRAEYSARRRTLLDALATHAPTLEVTGLAAGFHAVLNLPAGADEQRIVGQARQRGVGVYGLGRMRRAPGPPALVLGFGDTPRHRIEPGIAAVADLLTGQETGPAR